MADALVDSLDRVLENIVRYQDEVGREPELVKRMKRARAWYAIRSDDGTWLFAPSMFVGYEGGTAEAYLARPAGRDGRRSERVLGQWFDVVQAGTPLEAELDSALRVFLGDHGHSGPNKRARICIRKEIPAGRADNLGPGHQARIHIDPTICGGRPHIRGTRVRVSDILDLLAGGASHSEILTDYPYLSDDDLRAALAYGAAATEHRVILAA